MAKNTLSWVFVPLLSLFILLSTGWAGAPCVRHNNVGFFNQPEVLGELAQVYANCYPQPACPNRTDLQTIQIDGYINYSGWLWNGPSSSTFTVAQQNQIINDAIVRANNVKPPGKVVVSIAFLRDVIVGPSSQYGIYCRVTFARCSQPKKDKGMTWFHTASNTTYGTITVGCGPDGPNRCDPAHGDTPCTQQLPVLCIYKPKPAFLPPVGLPIPNQYNEWSGGVVATTPPHAGTFKDTAEVNKFCSDVFGPGWRVAEFHDGVSWNFQAYGGTVSAPTVPSTRFWLHINDQPDGNCWQP
jgi:hypothetical protein